MPKSQPHKALTSKHIAHVLILIGILAALSAVLLLVRQHNAEPSPPSGALTSRSAPSSVKPKPQATASYSVPATHPKYIAIPTIGIRNTPVLKLGLLGSGAIATPDNIFEAGWYDASSLPGQAGAMFIYGHVSSWKADGIFYDLKKLKAGDTVTITRGDDKTYTYRVVKSVVYPYNDVPMNTVLAPVSAHTPGLNLMTCTGQIVKGTSEFSERLVVYTSLVGS